MKLELLTTIEQDEPMPNLDTRQKVLGFMLAVNYGYRHGALAPNRALEMLQVATDSLMELKR